MTKGYLALILHAHLPYVRHPEYKYSLEEKWYFEAVTETYLPLLAVFRRLQSDGIPFRITVSVSPTLATMWEDSYLQEKYRDWLARLLDLADKEVVRTAKDPVFSPLARLYRQRLQQAYHEYFDLYHCNLAGVLREFAGSGNVELISSAATHGYLTLLNTQPEAVYAQLCIAVEEHTRIFGKPPGASGCRNAPMITELMKCWPNWALITFSSIPTGFFCQAAPGLWTSPLLAPPVLPLSGAMKRANGSGVKRKAIRRLLLP